MGLIERGAAQGKGCGEAAARQQKGMPTVRVVLFVGTGPHLHFGLVRSGAGVNDDRKHINRAI